MAHEPLVKCAIIFLDTILLEPSYERRDLSSLLFVILQTDKTLFVYSTGPDIWPFV